MYAIIQDSGSQIMVQVNDVIKIAKRDLPAGQATITFDNILLVGGEAGKDARIGQPSVAGAKVTADILGEGKTDRVVIRKFRRRKNYVRHRGHRQDYIEARITAIEG